MRRILFSLALFLAGSFSASAESTPRLPFAFVNGFILIKAELAGQRQPLTFLVDSGASTSVLNLTTARRLHLSLGRAETAHGVGSDVTAYHLEPLSLTSSGRELSKVGLTVDLHNATLLCGQPVDGLIGADFFERNVVQIDYSKRQLRLLQGSPSAGDYSCSLPMRSQNAVFCVAVSVNGSHPRWTRLDTGCNDPLHWVVPRATAPHQKKEVSLGFMTDERDMTLASVQLGAFPLKGVQTSLHGEPLFPDEAGLLGNGLLSRYLVTVDAPHRRLLLKPARR